MNPQQGGSIGYLVHNQRDVLRSREFVLEADDLEGAVLGRKLCFGSALEPSVTPHPVGHKVADAAEFEPVPLSELAQLGKTRHAPVVVHDFADRCPRR